MADLWVSGYEDNQPPKTPVEGDVWLNMSGVTIQGLPPGHYAVWNGTSWVDAGSEWTDESDIEEQEDE